MLDFDVKKIVNKNVLCTSCNSSVKQLVLKGKPRSHPFLDTLLCEKCYSFFGDGDFSVDEDGSDKYCRWCGQGGTLYLCSKCTAGFCKKCIKRNLPRAIWDEVFDDEWQCLCCNVKPLYGLRALCWAAQKYANANSKEKSEPASGKRKGRKTSDDEESDDNSSRRTKKAKKDDTESVEEETSNSSRRGSSRKPKKVEPKDEDSQSPKTSKKGGKSTRKSKARRTVDVEDDESSSDEKTQNRLAEKTRNKQFKLARSKISAVLVDIVKLNDVTKNKANDFKKKKVTAQKVCDLESFSSTAHSVTNLLKSVEDMSQQLRLTFAEFVTKFEETVKEMDKGEENGVQDEENGDVDSKEEKDNVDSERPHEDKEEESTVEMKEPVATETSPSSDNEIDASPKEEDAESATSKGDKGEEEEEVEEINDDGGEEKRENSSDPTPDEPEKSTVEEITRPEDES